jgi:hypothetical protein
MGTIMEEESGDPQHCNGAAEAQPVQKIWTDCATDVPDPPQCIAECQQQFLATVIPGYDETSLKLACESLTSGGSTGDKRFWSLYCCDSSRCGVWMDADQKKLGQDREFRQYFCSLESF